jgi:hypothetical protein
VQAAAQALSLTDHSGGFWEQNMIVYKAIHCLWVLWRGFVFFLCIIGGRERGHITSCVIFSECFVFMGYIPFVGYLLLSFCPPTYVPTYPTSTLPSRRSSV